MPILELPMDVAIPVLAALPPDSLGESALVENPVLHISGQAEEQPQALQGAVVVPASADQLLAVQDEAELVGAILYQGGREPIESSPQPRLLPMLLASNSPIQQILILLLEAMRIVSDAGPISAGHRPIAVGLFYDGLKMLPKVELADVGERGSEHLAQHNVAMVHCLQHMQRGLIAAWRAHENARGVHHHALAEYPVGFEHGVEGHQGWVLSAEYSPSALRRLLPRAHALDDLEALQLPLRADPAHRPHPLPQVDVLALQPPVLPVTQHQLGVVHEQYPEPMRLLALGAPNIGAIAVLLDCSACGGCGGDGVFVQRDPIPVSLHACDAVNNNMMHQGKATRIGLIQSAHKYRSICWIETTSIRGRMIEYQCRFRTGEVVQLRLLDMTHLALLTPASDRYTHGVEFMDAVLGVWDLHPEPPRDEAELPKDEAALPGIEQRLIRFLVYASLCKLQNPAGSQKLHSYFYSYDGVAYCNLILHPKQDWLPALLYPARKWDTFDLLALRNQLSNLHARGILYGKEISLYDVVVSRSDPQARPRLNNNQEFVELEAGCMKEELLGQEQERLTLVIQEIKKVFKIRVQQDREQEELPSIITPDETSNSNPLIRHENEQQYEQIRKPGFKLPNARSAAAIAKMMKLPRIYMALHEKTTSWKFLNEIQHIRGSKLSETDRMWYLAKYEQTQREITIREAILAPVPSFASELGNPASSDRHQVKENPLCPLINSMLGIDCSADNREKIKGIAGMRKHKPKAITHNQIYSEAQHLQNQAANLCNGRYQPVPGHEGQLGWGHLVIEHYRRDGDRVAYRKALQSYVTELGKYQAYRKGRAIFWLWKAKLEEEAGSYREAIRCLQAAVRALQKGSWGSRVRQLGVAHHELGRLFHETRQLDSCVTHYKQSLLLKQQWYGKYSPELLVTLYPLLHVLLGNQTAMPELLQLLILALSQIKLNCTEEQLRQWIGRSLCTLDECLFVKAVEASLQNLYQNRWAKLEEGLFATMITWYSKRKRESLPLPSLDHSIEMMEVSASNESRVVLALYEVVKAESTKQNHETRMSVYKSTQQKINALIARHQLTLLNFLRLRMLGQYLELQLNPTPRLANLIALSSQLPGSEWEWREFIYQAMQALPSEYDQAWVYHEYYHRVDPQHHEVFGPAQVESALPVLDSEPKKLEYCLLKLKHSHSFEAITRVLASISALDNPVVLYLQLMVAHNSHNYGDCLQLVKRVLQCPAYGGSAGRTCLDLGAGTEPPLCLLRTPIFVEDIAEIYIESVYGLSMNEQQKYREQVREMVQFVFEGRHLMGGIYFCYAQWLRHNFMDKQQVLLQIMEMTSLCGLRLPGAHVLIAVPQKLFQPGANLLELMQVHSVAAGIVRAICQDLMTDAHSLHSSEQETRQPQTALSPNIKQKLLNLVGNLIDYAPNWDRSRSMSVALENCFESLLDLHKQGQLQPSRQAELDQLLARFLPVLLSSAPLAPSIASLCISYAQQSAGSANQPQILRVLIQSLAVNCQPQMAAPPMHRLMQLVAEWLVRGQCWRWAALCCVWLGAGAGGAEAQARMQTELVRMVSGRPGQDSSSQQQQAVAEMLNLGIWLRATQGKLLQLQKMHQMVHLQLADLQSEIRGDRVDQYQVAVENCRCQLSLLQAGIRQSLPAVFRHWVEAEVVAGLLQKMADL